MTERKRRTPRQARAESTVDVILSAALQLLEADGAERLTTNHIAARAGVSIGTVYQYFRDKDDILAALAQQRAGAVRDSIADLVISPPGANAVRAIVQALTRSFDDAPRGRAALLDALYRRGGDGGLQQHHQAFLAAIEGRAQIGVELTPERAFILTHAPISLLRAAAAEPGLELDPAALEDELVRLLEAYLGALPTA
ncbi:TetR family transcriptional regulator [Phenylobacterium sp. Root77]|jgi:AcrR family transcriptional regulator|uniref:TetR/AcrR family transcriptional regulator n=1 Tax=unclassified Phenylobacterium TaxID=2640670 RepID=UPI0006FA872D|nr:MULTISPECIES: TetR/AcrR family transcriptional regulator [unclassified Phenylobacterium]KQW69354.1 TetR family transcriptional regulator [Phenylobacterium sp. Root1277]KQW95280.1 TetR family transcriptional regulator [Phenylobacterium sp. Root1290]KRC41071.1 TetR family transcriptional regulator [Phenylobacterium sp. Root77]